MNIIFLDFDGVLNRFFENNNLYTLDSSLVNRLYDTVKEIDARIVFTTSWRLLEKEKFVDKLKEIHAEKLLEFAFEDDMFTHSSRTKIPDRGSEVADWLMVHKDVDNYLIIDDNSDFHPDQHLLLIIPEIGFSALDALYVQVFFGKKDSSLLKYPMAINHSMIKICEKRIALIKKFQNSKGDINEN